jgi:hypothetical protein
MGQPQNLSDAQGKLLRAHAEPQYSTQILSAEADAKIHFEIGPNEILYIEIAPNDPTANTSLASNAEFAEWDRLMGEKSR